MNHLRLNVNEEILSSIRAEKERWILEGVKSKKPLSVRTVFPFTKFMKHFRVHSIKHTI